MPNSARILFVDDEPNVLQGLQRMLRGMRQEWHMAFASSGDEAVAMLEREGEREGGAFDVLVCDVRMPGMDGVQLLRLVKERWPSMVRIILSGYCEQEKILRSVCLAHVWLSKPCDADRLRTTVQRVVQVKKLLTSEQLRALAARMHTLPSLPTLYQQLVERLQSESASLREIGDLVARDVGMSAKVLQIVNSAFFALPRHVANPGDAAVLLGVDLLKSMVLALHVFATLGEGAVEELGLANLWEESARIACLSKRIVELECKDRIMADEAFVAGFLHGAGKLVLSANLPAEYRAAVQLAAREGIDLDVAEQRMLGATHQAVGAYLLGTWGFATSVVEAVAYQSRPQDCSHRAFGPLTALHAARALGRGQPERLHEDYLRQVAVLDRVPGWTECSEQLANAAPR